MDREWQRPSPLLTASSREREALHRETLPMLSVSRQDIAGFETVLRGVVALSALVASASSSAAGEQPPEGKVLVLRVIHARTGAPIPGARVGTWGPDQPWEDSPPSDPTATTRIPLPDQRLSILSARITKDGFVPVILHFERSVQEKHTVSLEPGTRIGGRVIDRESKPLAGATVCVRAVSEGVQVVASGRVTRLAGPTDEAYTTDADGRWSSDVLPDVPAAI
jgi:hypothetical protein